ncbi:MAG: protease complex subunit PrcB family protein [Gammaproteobacteria bacterium]|nr:protease complex subunit PrcB family protein [Gammaproteobacteria bacterium]
MNLRVLAANAPCAKAEKASIVEVDASQVLSARLPNSTPADNTVLKNERVLIISMGMRPTAGYLLNLASARAPLNGPVLNIPIVWREPAAGSMVAQVITQPCLMLAVEKGEYSEVRAMDQNGVERARLAL